VRRGGRRRGWWMFWGSGDTMGAENVGDAGENPVGFDGGVLEELGAKLSRLDEPPLDTGTLCSLDIGPEVIAHHRNGRRRSSQTRYRRLEERSARLAGDGGGLPAGELERCHERTSVEGEPVPL